MTKCVYCGAASGSRDHVPPKSAFAKPRPSDLITVPSCIKCNKGFARDDEYFKSHLGIRGDIEGAPTVETLTQEVLRSWSRPEGSGLAATFHQSLGVAPVHDADGTVLGHQRGHVVITDRVHRVIARTIRGLHFHEFGERLDGGYRLLALMWDLIPPGERLQYMALMADARLRTVGNGAFCYAVRPAADDPMSCAWLLQFYGAATFLGLTAPPGAAP